MTDELIKQAAYEYINSNAVRPENMQLAFGDFIAGAHSRDEEIKELGKSYHDMFATLANKIEQLRKPWSNVVERLPEEGQDILICNWDGRITRKEYISKGDINYMKEHPEVYTSWMLTPKPGLN